MQLKTEKTVPPITGTGMQNFSRKAALLLINCPRYSAATATAIVWYMSSVMRVIFSPPCTRFVLFGKYSTISARVQIGKQKDLSPMLKPGTGLFNKGVAFCHVLWKTEDCSVKIK